MELNALKGIAFLFNLYVFRFRYFSLVLIQRSNHTLNPLNPRSAPGFVPQYGYETKSNVCNAVGFLSMIYDENNTIYPKKYAHGFWFAVLCCAYTLTDFPISIRLTSLALWQSDDCPSASKATLMNMDKYFIWIHYERLHNHNKAKHNKTVCIFLGIYCRCDGNHSHFVPAFIIITPPYCHWGFMKIFDFGAILISISQVNVLIIIPSSVHYDYVFMV